MDNNEIQFVAENCVVQINILTDDLFQVKMIRPEEEIIDSIAIYKKNWPMLKPRIIEKEKYFEIETNKLRLRINYNPYRMEVYDKEGDLILADLAHKGLGFEKEGSKVRAVKALTLEDKFYGLGERTGFLNKRGEYHELWNFDQSSPHVHSTKHMYKSIPFLLGLRGKKAYGIFFDNTFLSRFDLGKESEDYFYFEADGGSLNYYVFYGPSLKTVVQRYTELTGRIELPPLWALGFQQSRYSYFPQDKVYEIAETFRKKEIPCDVIYLDIDYMDGYRVFTWDRERFPDPEKMLADLKEQGFKVVTIVDPGIKKDPDYWIYNEAMENRYLCMDRFGFPFVGKVWPGDSVFPDFSQTEVREWWAEKNREFVKIGIDGIWNDMNEPALLEGESKTMPLDIIHKNDGREITHAEFHNLYGTYMSIAAKAGLLKARPDERPFVLTRASFAGIQRFAAVWTGDNRSFWEHMAMSIPMLTTLGLSGVTFAGADIGGFDFDANPELFARWIQLGICYPFCRVHSAVQTRDQEPWSFGPEVEKVAKEYISLRYRLLPYLYNLFYRASITGEPIMQPLLFRYQDDEKVHNLNDQFMLGEAIMVAPVLHPGKDSRAVYLPEGEWYDFHTGEKYSGRRSILVDAPLSKMPIFIKAGSIIPMYPVVNYIGEKEIEELSLLIYPGPEAEYLYYEDDGKSFDYWEGKYNLTSFKAEFGHKSVNLTIVPQVNEYDSPLKYYKIILKGMADLNKVMVNGVEIEGIVVDNDLVIKLPVDEKF
ncbi:alpha-glucosidase [Anoxybacter fermentans]|uniref:Alpha-glucosidase n=1 Tax=Anoxybacter fermentans TaxID=1323375 RepID=A0A3Q9HSH7_9FIRM|nr:alpha-glucosidase [Anoxybacter fermentans]